MNEFDAAFAQAMRGNNAPEAAPPPAQSGSEFDAVFAQSMPQAATQPVLSLPGGEKKQKTSAYEQGRAIVNPVVRGLVNAAQGATFNFGDEILGALGAVGKAAMGQDFGDAYRETRDMYRGVSDQYAKDFPIGSIATQLAAGAPLTVAAPLGKLAGAGLSSVAPRAAANVAQVMNPVNAASGLIPRTLQAAGTGFGYGAIGGAGSSTGETVGEVAADAAKGGLISAAIGGATPAITSAIGGGVRNVASRVSDNAAANYARLKVAEAFGRDARGTLAQTGAVDAIDQAIPKLGRYGPEARVVDVGGHSAHGLLDVVATIPGRSKNAVEDAIRSRQAGRSDRLISAADSALRTRGQEFGAALDTLAETRKAAAAPLYAQLRGAVAEVDDDLMALIKRTEGVHGEAQKLYRLQTGEMLDLSKVQPGQRIPFSMLDTLKQSLFDAADSAKRSGGNKMGAAYDNVRVKLTDKLDSISPKDQAGNSIYKMARDAFAGPSQLIDAAETGRTAMRADSFVVKDALKNLSQSEIDAFRVGALQALKEKAGTQGGQSGLLRMWMEPATSGRLKDIFGQDYRQFAAVVAAESRMKNLESVGRGSQTAARQFGAGDLDVSPLKTIAAASSGSPSAIMQAVADNWNRVKTPGPVRDEIGRILLSRDPKQLQMMRGLLGDINRSQAQNAERVGAFSGLLQ